MRFKLKKIRQMSESKRLNFKTIFLVFTATVMVFVLNNLFYSLCYVSVVTSILYVFGLRQLKPFIGKQRRSIIGFHTVLFWLMSKPLLAQNTVTQNDAACTSGGLFNEVTNFVSATFSTITFGGIGGGSLSNLICQVIGFMVVGLLLAFIGTIGRVAYQISYEQQSMSAVINPLFGFLIFSGGVTVMVTVMLGTGTATG